MGKHDIMLSMTEKQLIDPRRALTIAYYKNPSSETFGNLTGSARRAGFDESYARVLTAKDRTPEWLTANTIEDVRAVKQAERNLRKYNDMVIDELKNRTDVEKAKIQIDVSKFLLKTQARQKYSEQQEDTPPSVQINIVNYNEPKDADVIVKDAEVVDPQG